MSTRAPISVSMPLQRGDGALVGRIAGLFGRDACRVDLDLITEALAIKGLSKQEFQHGGAADIARAHDADPIGHGLILH